MWAFYKYEKFITEYARRQRQIGEGKAAQLYSDCLK